MLGVALLVVAGLGVYIGVASSIDDVGAGGSAVMVTMLTIVAGAAIAVFGLRYLMLGFRGRGLRVYERAIEADFFDRNLVWPRRRLVPMLRVEVRGTAKLTRANAIAATGHAFALPSAVVDRSDPWYLGSLGIRPVAPGGRTAKEAYEAGELAPRERESAPEVPYHGPAWPDPPPLPRDTDEFTPVRGPVKAPAPARPRRAPDLAEGVPETVEPRREDMLEELPIDVPLTPASPPSVGTRPPPVTPREPSSTRVSEPPVAPPPGPPRTQAPPARPSPPAEAPVEAPAEAMPEVPSEVPPPPPPSPAVDLMVGGRVIEDEPEDLPDTTPPPPRIPPPPPRPPPPPVYREAPVTMPSSMASEAEVHDGEPGTPVIDEGGWELEELPEPTASPPVPTPPPPATSPTPTPPPSDSGGWELEEVPPPASDDQEPPKKKASGGWDWEEV
jgi:hypothetical protein